MWSPEGWDKLQNVRAGLHLQQQQQQSDGQTDFLTHWLEQSHADFVFHSELAMRNLESRVTSRPPFSGRYLVQCLDFFFKEEIKNSNAKKNTIA